MDNISICVTFIAGIFGIAYPILLEVVSRLDEKYSSLIIIDLFNTELEKKYFTASLIASLISIFLWMLKLPPLISINGLDRLVGNSAEYLLILCSTSVVLLFFLFVRKVLIYYAPTRFIPYLIKRHNESSDSKDYLYFRAVSDLLYFSIKNQNETVAKTISSFLYGAFKDIREISSDNEVTYPTPFYEVVSKTIEELATVKNKRLIFLGHRTAGSVWLLGEFGSSKISEATYSWIWSNIQLALSYDRDDFVIFHWEQAYQYARTCLSYITPEYSDESFEVTNKKAIEERVAERRRFLEFHYALGGLLVYKRRHEIIKQAFTYTQSIPPQYELLPESMDEVFEQFFEFRDPYETRHTWISHKYSFPDFGGLHSDLIIKRWICTYIAVLFLRQYSIVPYLVTMRPLGAPAIPLTQSGKKQWIDNLDYFKHLVTEVLQDRELLKTVGLDFVTDEWCEENDQLPPLKFIEEVKQNIIASFEGTQIEQTISEQKFEKFKEASADILAPVIKEYDVLQNKGEVGPEVNTWFVKGQSNVIDKSAFADNQEAEHINFHSFLPESFANVFRGAISEMFVLATTRSYLLNSQDIAQALCKLEVDYSQYVIVSFGVDIDALILSNGDQRFKKVEVINIKSWNYRLVGDSIFILKRDALPSLKYKEITDKEIEKYSLKKVIDEYNLYVSVVDLNQSDELRETLAETYKDRDLRKSVYMAIFINLEVHWKKVATCVRIKQASPYRERGIVNNLNDVKAVQ